MAAVLLDKLSAIVTLPNRSKERRRPQAFMAFRARSLVSMLGRRPLRINKVKYPWQNY